MQLTVLSMQSAAPVDTEAPAGAARGTEASQNTACAYSVVVTAAPGEWQSACCAAGAAPMKHSSSDGAAASAPASPPLHFVLQCVVQWGAPQGIPHLNGVGVCTAAGARVLHRVRRDAQPLHPAGTTTQQRCGGVQYAVDAVPWMPPWEAAGAAGLSKCNTVCTAPPLHATGCTCAWQWVEVGRHAQAHDAARHAVQTAQTQLHPLCEPTREASAAACIPSQVFHGCNLAAWSALQRDALRLRLPMPFAHASRTLQSMSSAGQQVKRQRSGKPCDFPRETARLHPAPGSGVTAQERAVQRTLLAQDAAFPYGMLGRGVYVAPLHKAASFAVRSRAHVPLVHPACCAAAAQKALPQEACVGAVLRCAVSPSVRTVRTVRARVGVPCNCGCGKVGYAHCGVACTLPAHPLYPDATLWEHSSQSASKREWCVHHPLAVLVCGVVPIVPFTGHTE